MVNKAPQQSLSRFDACWLAEAVRLHEQHSSAELSSRFAEPLPALTSACSGVEEAWLLRRAQVIGSELGMLETIRRWRRHANVVLALLAALAIISGFSAALGFFGAENRAVNVIWTLLGLIGLPLLALLLWIFGVALSAGRDAPGGIFGRLWLWLATRWPVGAGPARDKSAASELQRQPRDDLMAHALATLMNRSGLEHWWLSVITHSLWLLLLASTLTAMLLALSLRSYGFVLETTILSPEVFTRLVQGFGALPAQIGFTVPDTQMIGMALAGDVATQAEPARRAWSSWLVGGLLVYAILPRLVVWVFAFLRLQLLFRRMGLDLALPAYAELLAREARRTSPGIVDAAPPAPAQRRVADVHRVPGRSAVLLGLELRSNIGWPPGSIAAARPTFTVAEIVDSREQRRSALARLRADPPARLLVACDAGLSPDRGTLEWLVDVSHQAGELRVWLVDAQLQVTPARLQAWQESLGAIGLSGKRVMTGETAAFDWLSHHD